MKGLFIWWCLLSVLPVAAQQEQKVVSLGEAIRLAREQSLDAMVAKSRLRSAYWAISKLQGRFVAQRDVDGNITEF